MMKQCRKIAVYLLICAVMALAGGSLAEEAAITLEPIIAAGSPDQTFEQGGALNELTVFQMGMILETGMLWLRVIGGAGWTQIDLNGFLNE